MAKTTRQKYVKRKLGKISQLDLTDMQNIPPKNSIHILLKCTRDISQDRPYVTNEAPTDHHTKYLLQPQ